MQVLNNNRVDTSNNTEYNMTKNVTTNTDYYDMRHSGRASEGNINCNKTTKC